MVASEKAEQRESLGGFSSLAPVQLQILVGLGQHRSHSAEQLHRLYAPKVSQTVLNRQLVDLRERGLVSFMRLSRGRAGRGPYQYHLTAKGGRLVRGLPEFDWAPPKVPEAGKMLAGHIHHHLAVNEVGYEFWRASSAEGLACSWRTEVEHSLAGPGVPNSKVALRSDAFLEVDTLVNGRPFTSRVLLELDRGTRNLDHIARQMSGYVSFFQARDAQGSEVWPLYYPRTFGYPWEGRPLVLWVFDGRYTEGRELSFSSLISQHYEPLLDAGKVLQVAVTTLARLREKGPYDAECFYFPYRDEWLSIVGESAPSGPVAAGA